MIDKSKCKRQITEWGAYAAGRPWDAPECCGIFVGGRTIDDGGKPTNINTSRVVASDGRFVLTRSGSVYELVGAPSPDYLVWLSEQGLTFDPAQPIKVRS